MKKIPQTQIYFSLFPGFLYTLLAVSVVILGTSSLFAQNAVPFLDISNETGRQIVIAQGTPEEICKQNKGYTAKYLKGKL